MPNKLREDKIALIREMAKAGWKGNYIAKVLGISHTIVYSYMRKFKIARRAYRKFSR
jgi:hypothetical protein